MSLTNEYIVKQILCNCCKEIEDCYSSFTTVMNLLWLFLTITIMIIVKNVILD